MRFYLRQCAPVYEWVKSSASSGATWISTADLLKFDETSSRDALRRQKTGSYGASICPNNSRRHCTNYAAYGEKSICERDYRCPSGSSSTLRVVHLNSTILEIACSGRC